MLTYPNKRAVCTITTDSHVWQSKVLAESVLAHFSDVDVHIFVVDVKHATPLVPSHIYMHHTQWGDLEELTAPNHKQYKRHPDALRWSLKPVAMQYLLQKGYQSVLYADNDLFFFGQADFLFEQLEQNRFLLCPHWRIKDPTANKHWFEVNFKDGLYNGGLVGATNQATDILEWWATACRYACEVSPKHGLFVDQKYLDLLPAEYEGIGIIRHRGCNVAFWNMHTNQRTLVDGQVLIDQQWPVVFIHFTKELMQEIDKGNDALLKPHLATYRNALDKTKNPTAQ